MIYYAIAAVFPLLINYYLYHRKIFFTLSEDRFLKSKKRMLVLAVLPMALLYGLRYEKIGNDTIGYVRFFETTVRKLSFSELFESGDERFEIGFKLYTKIISLFSDSYTIYFIITAIILFGVLARFAYKYTENPFVVLYMFMTLGTYAFYETGLRQALAMTVCLLAVDFVHGKKIIKFVLTVLVAALFHRSAYIFLLLYPLAHIKRTPFKIIANVLAGLVAVGGFSFFQDLFNTWLGYDYEIEQMGSGQIFALLVTVIVIYALFVLSGNKDSNIGQGVIVQMALFSVIFWVLRLISRTAERISFYYTFGVYVYFAQTFKNDKDKMQVVARMMFLIAFFALFYLRNSGAVYKFFWQGA